MLTINKSLNNDSLTIELEGRLDTLTSPKLEEILEHDLEGINLVIFDLANLKYVSSSGLVILLKFQTTMKNNMILKNIRGEIMSVLQITGFDKFLNIQSC